MREKEERAGQGTNQRLYGAGSLIAMNDGREAVGSEQGPQHLCKPTVSPVG